jgi:hypothetical protein
MTLEHFKAKIERGEGLTMAERLQRQGLIFNHSGRMPPRNDHQSLVAADRRKARQGASAQLQPEAHE